MGKPLASGGDSDGAVGMACASRPARRRRLSQPRRSRPWQSRKAKEERHMAGEKLNGRVAIVTGAGSRRGIGRCVALGLVRAGAKVVLTDVNGELLDRNVAEANAIGGDGSAIGVVADVTDVQAVREAVGRGMDAFGGLHIVVNNAGITASTLSLGQGGAGGDRTWRVPPANFARVMDINVNGAFNLLSATVDHLVGQGWGRIIGITTNLETMVAPRETPYGPSKAAHEALVATLAQELAGTGVTANAVLPGGDGPTDTDQVALLMTSPGFAAAMAARPTMVSPDVMTAPCVWLASDEADGFTNQRIVGNRWDESLPLPARLAQAAAPAAWQQIAPRR